MEGGKIYDLSYVGHIEFFVLTTLISVKVLQQIMQHPSSQI